MAERRRTVTERALERNLLDLGRRIDYPSTPDLADRVRARIDRPRRPRPSWRPGALRLPLHTVAAVVTIAFALLAAIVTIPPARDAVAGWLGLRGVEIVPVPELPTVTAVPSGGRSTGALLLDGRIVSLAEAREMVAFPVLVPAASLVGQPQAVSVAGDPPGGRVTLMYAPSPDLPETRETGVGLLITQFRGESVPFIQKGLPQGATAMPVSIDGARAFWIAGVPHVLLTRDRQGAMHEQPSRLAANTLLWERDGITYRLEASLDLDAALRVAESMR